MRLTEARILFVDDEPSLLEIFSHWITGGENSHLISTAADGQQALELMLENTYDLLITDVKMPRMDGPSLVRNLAGSGKAIPAIIFVSGFGNVDERELYGLGVEAFLAKPVPRETLVTIAEHALAERSSLWLERLEKIPRQSISIEALDCRESAREGSIVFGRGGFSAPYARPIAPGRVSFDCHLSADGTKITGEGFVRWRSKEEGTIGVEIAFLEESCRAATAERITNENPRAFIPSS
jgi:CheY-like chemotaxis protein